jgi:hypothetical protein
VKRLACWAAALLLGLSVAVARADEAATLLERSQTVETESTGLLLEHYRFEEALLSPDNDRLTVFLSMPHGARVIMNDVTLYVDEKKVLHHVFGVQELQLLRDRSSHLFYVSRLPPGSHSLRLEVSTMQGRVLPMKAYSFTKGHNAKFVELQIAGYPVREIDVIDW